MRGHTLFELVFALFLVGLATATAAPPVRRLADRTAAAAAREALVALLTEARAVAIERGGSVVHIESDPPRALVRAQSDTLRQVDFGSEFGVGLELGSGARAVDLSFDPLGLGRVVSQTVVLSRGDATAELIISSYGRVRRR